MDYALRSITFASDLIVRPKKHDPRQLQKVHQAVFDDSVCPYSNFSLVNGGAQLASPGSTQGRVSAVTILPDRVRIQEQGTGCGREDFVARLERIAAISMSQLELPAFIAQQFVVQSLVNPRRWADAKQFLANAVLQLGDDAMGAFDRKPALLGIRLAFPATPEQPGLFNVRVESYSQDNRSVFLENVGLYNKAITGEEMGAFAERFEETYGFLESNVASFLSHADV